MIIFRLDKGRFKLEQQFQEFNEWNKFWRKFSKKSEIKTGKGPISQESIFENWFISCRFLFL